jgi:two-component system C4-dicarboxylate transport sensor histidine kinase DctB
MSKTHWMGIRSRLLLAFGVLSAFTLFASIVGWVSHNRLGEEFDVLVKGSIKTLQLVTEIKERGVRVITLAPTLLAAADKGTQQQIHHTLNQNINAMTDLLPQVVALTHNKQLNKQTQPIDTHQFNNLQQTIQGLNRNVNRTLALKQQKQSLNSSLRWAASVFLSDIDLLNQTIEKHLYQRFDQDSSSVKTIIANELQRMYRLKADVNLLINLLDRAQYLPDLNSLIATNIHSDEVIERIQKDITALSQIQGMSALQRTISNIISLAQAQGNIFDLRSDERQITERGAALLSDTNTQLQSLNLQLEKLADSAELTSQDAISNAQLTIKRGRMWMVSLVAGSLLFSILIVWLYVGRNMVARITHLDSAMRSIANGNLDQPIAIKGRDEIGTMARSLQSFRDQLSTLQEDLVQAGKLAALGQLSAGIAHEINQPLSAIQLYARNGTKLLQAQRIEETDNNLQQISSLTKRAINIITRLRSLARDEQQQLQRYEIKTVIDDALQTLNQDKTLNLNIVQLDFQHTDNLAMIDPIQLEQVIINLITNAFDAINQTQNPQVILRCIHTKDYFELYVEDSGPGIDKALSEKIFDPFFSTKRRGQNLGLGLSISYNIIKSFAGKLSVKSAPNNSEKSIGASFCIQLPKK